MPQGKRDASPEKSPHCPAAGFKRQWATGREDPGSKPRKILFKKRASNQKNGGSDVGRRGGEMLGIGKGQSPGNPGILRPRKAWGQKGMAKDRVQTLQNRGQDSALFFFRSRGATAVHPQGVTGRESLAGFRRGS
jgi:hypothetical protein